MKKQPLNKKTTDIREGDSPTFKIDELDKAILKIITKNARTPFLEVARECNVSGAAIHQRIQRLTAEGIITGSEFTVSKHKLGYSTCAYLAIYLEKAHFDKTVVPELQKIPEVVECHSTTGSWNLLIKIICKSNKDLKRVIDDKLQDIEGISRTETFISLGEHIKRQTPIQ